jgi:ABC-type bacteriocin/lantibiotic exporter with double-glycine peptidase domain
MRTSATTSWLLDWPFVLMFLIVLLYINWAAAIITAIFMVVMYNLVTWKRNMTMSQETQGNIEICLNGLQTIVIMAVGATMIIAGTLDIGLLIGSNILAARALQGTSKYAKAIEFSKQRDQAVGEIINYVKSK